MAHRKKRKPWSGGGSQVAGALLLLLSAYIVFDAGWRLLGYGSPAEESIVGIVLTAVSLVVMPFFGWAKLRAARELGSSALRADAYETIACAWLSLTTLSGLVLNAWFGWDWADPLAALVLVPLIVREGLEAWQEGFRRARVTTLGFVGYYLLIPFSRTKWSRSSLPARSASVSGT